jgi:pimeloyl-ACP methyl ester carboxylesterase
MRTPLLLLAILAAITLALHLCTRSLAAQAERDFPDTGKFVEVEGLHLRYVEKGSGQPVVFLHGIYGGLEDFTSTIFDEAAKHCRAIAFDRPGHGYSDRPDHGACGPAEQARILHHALTKLGIERPILVGFSWSGALVTAYTLQFQDDVAGLMTINGVLYEWDGITSPVTALAGLPLFGRWMANTIALPFGLFSRQSSVANAFSPALVDARFGGSPIPLALRPRDFLVNNQEMRALKASLRITSPHYGEITVPYTIVAGTGDRVTHFDFHAVPMHRAVAGSRLVAIEGGGHQVMYSHSAQVLAALAGLLDEVSRRETSASGR